MKHECEQLLDYIASSGSYGLRIELYLETHWELTDMHADPMGWGERIIYCPWCGVKL